MSWDELYPVVKTQAYFAVLGMKNRKEEKIKFRNLFVSLMKNFRMMSIKGKEIKKQEYKCFITQRAKAG